MTRFEVDHYFCLYMAAVLAAINLLFGLINFLLLPEFLYLIVGLAFLAYKYSVWVSTYSERFVGVCSLAVLLCSCYLNFVVIQFNKDLEEWERLCSEMENETIECVIDFVRKWSFATNRK